MEASAGQRTGAPRVAPATVVAVLVAAALVGVAAAVAARALLGGSSQPAAQLASGSSIGRHVDGLHGEATWAAGVRPAPPITTLTDQTGARFSLASLHGRTVAIEFFDSHCTQECPLAGRALAASERALPAAQRPVLVVVSVNPKDTRASVRAAIRKWGLAGLAPWHWLMGTHAQLAPVWRTYHIEVKPTKSDIEHTEALLLLDRRGYERSGYLYPYAPRDVAGDLRLLARGTAAGKAQGA